MLGNGSGYESAAGSWGFDYAQNPLAALASGVPEIGDAVAQDPSSSLSSIIDKVLAGYTLHQQQKDFLKLNQTLIQQGQAPISWDQYGAQAAVGLQLDSQTKMILMVVAGAAVLGALGFFGRRR